MSGWMRAAAFADDMGVTTVTVQRWCKAGTIRARKIGGLWFVHRSELDEGYDVDRAESQRGEPVPAEPGPTLGGDGHDAGRTPPVKVRRVESRSSGQSAGAHPAAGRRHPTGSPSRTAWTLPPEVAS
jgi:excisionase family DNA binding protein